jgi:hypothetical protein
VAAPLLAQTPTFQHDVRPIFEKRCNACHGAAKSAGLDTRTLDSIMAGGATGPAIEPGKPDASFLWKKIASDSMPLGGTKLTAAEKDLVRLWIEQGQFPGKASREKTITAQHRQLWAFRSPVKHSPPTVANHSQVRHPIDAFLLAKLEAKGLRLNPAAPSEKLIRRAYYDLTGLPPTPEEVRAFSAQPDFAALVDKLLASERYGERWARHWLDVAGYADSNGFLGDEPRPHAWRYRDWVIRALNRDMPYHQFITEQFAGDQMVDWKYGAPLSPAAVDKLIATGFLRLGPDGTDNQSIYEIDKQYDALHAATEISMKALLGMSLACARCHDHKFDPVLQKDYYRIMAALRPVFDPDETFPAPQSKWLPSNIGSGEWPARLVPNGTPAQLENYVKLQREAAADKSFGDLQNTVRQQWFAAQLAALPLPERSLALAALSQPETQRNDAQKRLLLDYGEKFKPNNPALDAFSPELKQARAAQAALAARVAAARPEMIWAAWDVSPRAATRVLLRGDYESPGDPVEPGVPVVLDDPAQPFAPAQTGRRLAFAQWLTRPGHPLTARVIVNRVWQYHFGAGIVATPDDFGSQGAPPTHPELLDYLAVGFVENGWSLKWLHRQIMLSAAYQQTSQASPEALKADEPNRLLSRWPARRLEAEAIRDGILSASGLLNLTMYGAPIPLCAAPDGNFLPDATGRIDGETIRGFNFKPPACQPAKANLSADRDPHRRSVYLQIRRIAGPGLLVAFDAPLMDSSAGLRFRAALPQQALAALHDPLLFEAAAALAARAQRDAGDDRVAQLKRAIELVYARPAQENEIQFGFDQLARENGLTLFCQALLGSSAFLYID